MSPPDHIAALGPWRDLWRLTAGGFGAVYRARDEQGRDAVVKFPLDSGDPEQLLRFEREVMVHSRLADVPGTVPFLGHGQSPHGPWMALAWMEGGSLEERLHREGRLEPAEALAMAREIAEAVANAHRIGLVHRDLKPANVLLDETGRPAISDYGLARAGADVHVTLSTTGESLSTKGYAPPEQITNFARTGPSGDVFALGVIFHELVYGRRPFRGSTSVAVLSSIQSGRVSPGTESPALTELFDRCLAPQAEERYADAAELAAALDELDSDDLEPQTPSSSLGLALVGLLGLTVVALGLALYLLWPAETGPGPEPLGGSDDDPKVTRGGDPDIPKDKIEDPPKLSMPRPGDERLAPVEPRRIPTFQRLMPLSPDRVTVGGKGRGDWKLRRHVSPLAIHRGLVTGLSLSPDGALILSVGYSGVRCLIDSRTGELLGRRTREGGQYRSCAWAGDGRWTALGLEDGTVELEPRGGGPTTELTLPARARDLVGLPGEAPRMLAATDKGVFLVTATKEGMRQLGGPPSSKRLALHAPSMLAVAIRDEDATLHDLQRGTSRLLRASPEGHGNEACAFAPDGRHLAIARRLEDGRGEIEIVTVPEGEVFRRWEVKGVGAEIGTKLGAIQALHFLPEGDLLSGGAAGVIYRWKEILSRSDRSGTPTHQFVAQLGSWVRTLTFSPETRHVFSGSNNCVVRRDPVEGAVGPALKTSRPCGFEYTLRVGSAPDVSPPRLLMMPIVGYAGFITPDGEGDRYPSICLQQTGRSHYVYSPKFDRLMAIDSTSRLDVNRLLEPTRTARVLLEDKLTAVTFDDATATYFCMDDGGRIRGVSLSTNEVTLEARFERPESVLAMYPTGSARKVEVACRDGSIRLCMKGVAGSRFTALRKGIEVQLVARTPNRDFAAMAIGRRVLVRDRLKPLKTPLSISFSQDMNLQELRLSDDGRFVLMVTGGSQLVAVDMQTLKSATFNGSAFGGIQDARFFPGSSSFAVVSRTGVLQIYDSTAPPSRRKRFKRKVKLGPGRGRR